MVFNKWKHQLVSQCYNKLFRISGIKTEKVNVLLHQNY